jgi:hypothetical protein
MKNEYSTKYKYARFDYDTILQLFLETYKRTKPSHAAHAGRLSVYCAASRLVVLVIDQADTMHGFLRIRASVVFFGTLSASWSIT